MEKFQITTVCPVHKIEYELVNGNLDCGSFLYCLQCDKESHDENLFLERTFIEFLRKYYFASIIFPFFYSILSMAVEFSQFFGFEIKYVLPIKIIFSIFFSYGLTLFLIDSRKKNIRPVIPLSPIKPLDIKKSQVE